MSAEAARIITLGDTAPEIAPDAWVAPGATVVGAVRLGSQASIWYGAVLRADRDRIDIGPRCNIQDGCVVHADPGFPVSLGASVSVGHRAVVHGAQVGDHVLVGMGAIVMNGVRIGPDCLVAAGALLPEGTEIPAGSLVVGAPGRVRRALNDEERQRVRRIAATYEEQASRHAEATG